MRRTERPGPAVPSPIARLLGDDDEGQLEPQNSIVLHSKLAGYRSSMAEPYFKTRQQRAAKAGDGGEMVQMRKKTAAMGRDFASLLSAHERQEASVGDLRQKVRTLRAELEQRDKALDLARRTVDRLNADKGQLEAGAAGTQAYVRRLEARLLSVKHAAELQQRCSQYKSQLDQMAHAVHETEARATAAEASARQSQLDAACLKRGLELAAEQLTKSAGAEVPGTLLRAVARGQEEALGLSMQLSDAKQQLAQVSTALEQAREHLQAQQQALTQHQSERQQLLQRAEAADAALERQRAATTELRRVLDALKPKAGALAVERDSLLQQLELERTAAAEAQKEAKQLRAALRQKATIEGALRDELRRALAGEGLTPSPAAAKQRRSPAAAGPRAAGLAPSRSGSRLRQQQQQQQQQRQAAAASSSVQPSSKRVGSPGAQSAHKVVVRHASAWEQQELAQQALLGTGSLSKGQGQQQHGGGSGSGVNSSGSGGLIPAEPSPTRALLRLQEQRRQQQGSRLGMQQQQRQEHPVGWEDAVAGWQLDLAEPLAAADAANPSAKGRGGRLELESCGELLSPPSSGARPAGRPHHHQNQALQQQKTALPAAAVLPVQDGRLMQLYSVALDEQIAALETDLAQLGVAGAAALAAQLPPKGPGDAPTADPAGKQQAAVPSAELGSSCGAAKAQVQLPGGAEAPALREQRQHKEGQLQGAIGAWRPNSTFDAASPAGQSMQRLMSSGGGAPTLAGSTKLPVPTVWHSNPLAASPPKRQREEVAEDEERSLPEQLADGALTIRARPAAAADQAPAAAPRAAVGSGEADAENDWVWAQLRSSTASPDGCSSDRAGWQQPQDAALPEAAAEVGAGSAASSPSLRMPATEWSEQQQGDEEQQMAVEDEQSEFELQPHAAPSAAVPAASAASQGGSDSGGGVRSLSHHWDLPSPGPGNSDWLSTEFEPDIEQLEVNSRLTPAAQRPQQQQGETEREAAVAALAEGGGAWDGSTMPGSQPQQGHQQAQQLPDRPPSSGSGGGWASQWGSSCGSDPGEGAPLLVLPRSQGQQHPRSVPLLPGLALVSDSPEPAPASRSPQVPAPQQPPPPQQAQTQPHTLFDLAGMDMADFLA